MASFNLAEKLKKCKIVHNNKYDYSQHGYIHSKTKINIICPIHGLFQQLLCKHETGRECQKCGDIKRRCSRSEPYRIAYINRAKEKHPNYDYSKTKYKKSRGQVTITCFIHGDFSTEANSFLRLKIGCPTCSREIITAYNQDFGYGWNRTNWKKCGNKAKKFDSFKAYVIKCWSKDEVFYKIGRTYNKLKRRFSCTTDMPYRYEPIHIFEYEDSDHAYDKEISLHALNKKNKYIPKKEFGGRYECYSKIDLS